jgi:hypothetical protein
VRTKTQKHAQHRRHVLWTGVQHAVERDAIDLGGTVEDASRTVGLVWVEDCEVRQKPVEPFSQLIRLLLAELLHVAVVDVVADCLCVLVAHCWRRPSQLLVQQLQPFPCCRLAWRQVRALSFPQHLHCDAAVFPERGPVKGGLFSFFFSTHLRLLRLVAQGLDVVEMSQLNGDGDFVVLLAGDYGARVDYRRVAAVAGCH